jgi:hypothetical protein
MLHTPVKHFNITPTHLHLRSNPDFLKFELALATIATHVAMVAGRVARAATCVAGHLSAAATIARPFLTIARRVAMVAAAQATIATDPLKANKPHLGTISQDFHHFFNRFASAGHNPGGARHKTISYG